MFLSDDTNQLVFYIVSCYGRLPQLGLQRQQRFPFFTKKRIKSKPYWAARSRGVGRRSRGAAAAVCKHINTKHFTEPEALHTHKHTHKHTWSKTPVLNFECPDGCCGSSEATGGLWVIVVSWTTKNGRLTSLTPPVRFIRGNTHSVLCCINY